MKHTEQQREKRPTINFKERKFMIKRDKKFKNKVFCLRIRKYMWKNVIGDELIKNNGNTIVTQINVLIGKYIHIR